MDLKGLQVTVNSLDQLVLKLEGMGFDSSILDDLPEAVESIKMAAKDARTFRKSTLIATLGASAVAFSVAAHFAIGYAVDLKIAKIERNQAALELLDGIDGQIRIDPIIDRKTGGKILTLSSSNRLILSEDFKTAYIQLKP